jgi:competence protein ComEA
MNFNIAKSTLIAFGLLLSAGWSNAADSKAVAPQTTASKAAASTKSAKPDLAAKRKAAAKIKLVDINSASKDELKKLPGVKDAEADKIIAGRPYATKAHLLTHNVVDAGTYDGLKGLVIAKQPNKDASQNAAMYQKKK